MKYPFNYLFKKILKTHNLLFKFLNNKNDFQIQNRTNPKIHLFAMWNGIWTYGKRTKEKDGVTCMVNAEVAFWVHNPMFVGLLMSGVVGPKGHSIGPLMYWKRCLGQLFLPTPMLASFFHGEGPLQATHPHASRFFIYAWDVLRS